MQHQIGVLAQAPDRPLTSSAWIRLLLPLQKLHQRGDFQLRRLEWPNPQLPISPRLKGLSALIVQRAACPSLPWAEALVANSQKRGLPLIFDLDDALFALENSHPEVQRYEPTLNAIDYLLSEASLRVYSNKTLAEKCEEHLKQKQLNHGPYALLANGLERAIWKPRRFRCIPTSIGSPLELLYMGTRTHDGDLGQILPELDALAASEPNLFRLTLIGGVSRPLLGDRAWLHEIEVPMEARRYPQFVAWLREIHQSDLGLAPLAPNSFNAAKSDLKVLDYAALGLPTLCSIGSAYDDLIAAGLAIGAMAGEWGDRIRYAARQRLQLRWRAYRTRKYLWNKRSAFQMACSWGELLSPKASWRHLSP
jgi:hypothetical protein